MTLPFLSRLHNLLLVGFFGLFTLFCSSLEARSKSSLSLPGKVELWQGIRYNPHLFQPHEIVAFIENHGHWPCQEELCKKAEGVLIKAGSSQEQLAWFAKHPPQTLAGTTVYAMALKDTKKIKALVKTAWGKFLASMEEEKKFLKDFGHHLSQNMHQERLRFCLGKGQVDSLKRLIPHLSPERRQVAKVSLAFLEGRSDALQKLQALPVHLHQDPDLSHMVATWHKEKKNIPEAARLLESTSPHPESSEYWWKTRQYVAREHIGAQEYERAYQLLADHNLKPGGEDFANAEWLLGWLALRFLDRPQEAHKHFQNVTNHVKGAMSKGRGQYWLGRTFEHMGDVACAAKAYGKAARYTLTYYGQLAAAKIKEPAYPCLCPIEVTAQQKARFEEKDLVKAARFLKKCGKKADQDLRHILMQIGENASNQGEKELAVQLAATLSPPTTVWVARKAGHRDPLCLKLAFPTCPIPCRGRETPEDAFVMAIAYQESRFDPAALSEKKAMGLLQLLNGTATREAKRLGIAYKEAKLFDPQYNVRLGAAHLGSLLKEFEGSYILVAVAYNAGPHVARRWIAELGDPRDPQVDIIDWIERIPYYETRNYVQRVLELVTTYRCVNGVPCKTLVDDLQQGRP